jgi:hypothetical protein
MTDLQHERICELEEEVCRLRGEINNLRLSFKMATTDPSEYDCVDCGRHVVSWMIRPEDGRCSNCAWIVENIPAEEQAVVREHLGVELKRKDASA